jgi:hypothetical protein
MAFETVLGLGFVLLFIGIVYWLHSRSRSMRVRWVLSYDEALALAERLEQEPEPDYEWEGDDDDDNNQVAD